MFVTLLVINVMWLDLFRNHSTESSWLYLDHNQIELSDFAEAQQHRSLLGPLEERYKFHWPHSEGPSFIVMINERELKNDRYLVAISNLFILVVWATGTALAKVRGGPNKALQATAAAPGS